MTLGNETAVYIPLIIILISLVLIEIRTTLIPDLILFPASIYFLIVRGVIGPEPWWHYLIAIVAFVGFFVLLAYLIEIIFGADTIGGGAIKLSGMVGAALGFNHSIEFAALFIGISIFALCIGRFVKIRSVHSSMYALLSFILILIYR